MVCITICTTIYITIGCVLKTYALYTGFWCNLTRFTNAKSFCLGFDGDRPPAPHLADFYDTRTNARRIYARSPLVRKKSLVFSH